MPAVVLELGHEILRIVAAAVADERVERGPPGGVKRRQQEERSVSRRDTRELAERRVVVFDMLQDVEAATRSNVPVANGNADTTPTTASAPPSLSFATAGSLTSTKRVPATGKRGLSPGATSSRD
jgi:hypothetical protein